MRRFAFPLALVTLLSSTLPSGLAIAAPPAAAAKPKPVRESLDDAGKKDWDAALALFGARDYQGALAEFQAVYDRAHDPRVLNNMAVCERSLLHYVRASELLQKELDTAGDKLTPEDRASVQQTIKGLDSFITDLTVDAGDADATVTIDGQPRNDPKSPNTFPKVVRIEPGRHLVMIHKDLFLDPPPQEVMATASAGARVHFDKLAPMTRRVAVDVTATAAATDEKPVIEIDGTNVGRAPYKGFVEAGKVHTIRAFLPGREAEYETGVWPNEADPKPVTTDQSVSFSLTKKANDARITIIAHPIGATIKLDGKVVTENSLFDDAIAATGHHLEIAKDGFDAYADEITLKPGEKRTIEQSLKQDKTAGIVFWATGSVLVVTGGIIASIFVFKARHTDGVPGTLNPGLDTTSRGLHF